MSDITLWQDQKQLVEIKKIYGKDLTDGEWQTFLGIGRLTGLNPFTREIYAVKYNSGPASIFIGRDGYRKSAQDNPNYDYHYTDSVYSNDDFAVQDGEVKHKYTLSDRGVLCGAYCIVKRKSSTKPMCSYVDFGEYYGGHKDANGVIKKGKYGEMKPTIWDTKPSTMIKKVAEAQTLRMAFQSIFSGTYDESESWDVPEQKTTITKEEKAKAIDSNVDQVTGEIIEKKRLKVITQTQIDDIYSLVEEYIIQKDPDKDESYVREKAKMYVDVNKISSITFVEAKKKIVELSNKIKAFRLLSPAVDVMAVPPETPIVTSKSAKEILPFDSDFVVTEEEGNSIQTEDFN